MAKTIEVSHPHRYRNTPNNNLLIRQLAESSLKLNNQISEMTESLKALVDLLKSTNSEEEASTKEIQKDGADTSDIPSKLDKILEQNYKLLQAMNELAGLLRRGYSK